MGSISRSRFGHPPRATRERAGVPALAAARWSAVAVGVLLLAACAAPAPAAPTATTATKPAAAVAPSPAPAAAASPAAKPAASPAPSVGAVSGVPSPSASPLSSPVAAPKPAAAETFDEPAVAAFYRGKTVRVVIGYASGGVIDTYSRTLARYLGKHLPGNPTVIVENRPGAGSLTAANTVFKTDPKDGTVIGSFGLGLVLQQLLGVPAVEFQADQYQWLGAAYADRSTCLVRSSVAQSIQELIGGKEVATGTLGQGSEPHQFPLSLNALLGTKFKVIPGYPSIAQARLAFDNGEIDAYCPSFSAVVALDRERLEGANPPAKMLVVGGENPPDHPLLRGVPRAADLVKTDDQRALLRALSLSLDFLPAYTMPPGVPRDRVLAGRQALAQTLVDPEFVADAERVNLLLNPRSGQDLEAAIRGILNIPQSLREQIRPIVT